MNTPMIEPVDCGRDRQAPGRRRHSLIALIGPVLLAGLLAGALAVVVVRSAGDDSITYRTMRANHAFDIEDRRASLAFADDVVLLEVRLVVRSFEDEFGLPWTDYRAIVHRSLDGDVGVGAPITVRQEGGIIGRELFVIEGEELLTPNRAYVAAGTIDAEGVFYIQAGVSTQDVRTVDSPAALTTSDEWARLGAPGNRALIDD